MSSTDLNHYQSQTSESKLRGQYYTPRELVAMMLESLQPTPRDWILDPACGDGSFLQGALEALVALVERLPDQDREAAARQVAGRLIGFDIHAEAVEAARVRLSTAFAEQLEVEVPPDQVRVFQADVLRDSDPAALLETAGISLRPAERLLVVGNPPYVEAKRLPRELRKELRRRFPGVLNGAPDLCLYFLHVCLGWLRPEDRLAFVLPNKVLVNSAAQGLREQLLEDGQLRRLWFATQARVFAEAAVYPVVLFAGGTPEEAPQGIETAQISRADAGGIQRSASTLMPAGWYRRTESRAFFPPPGSPVLREALDRLFLTREQGRLHDVLDIRWSVSFHRKGLRNRYVTPERPDSDQARRFLGGGAFSGNGEVTRYRLRWAGWWIDYHEEHLRLDENCVPPVALFEQPKIAICQHGRTLRAAFDPDGHILKDTFLCGVLREPHLYTPALHRHSRALVGLLCSRAVHFFYSHVFYGGHVNDGYLHFLRSFLVDVPLGEWDEERAAAVAELVGRRETSEDLEEQRALEEAIEQHVGQALGLTPEHQEAIRAWAEKDANWTLRERVRPPGPLLIRGPIGVQ